MNSRPGITRQLTLAALVWLARRGGALYTEACIHGECQDLRLDVVHCGPKRAPASTGIEVKSCRNDWLADEKCHLYLGRVSELYVATLPGVISPDELDEGCGLLELNEQWRAVPQAPFPTTPLLVDAPGASIPGPWGRIDVAEWQAGRDVFTVVVPAAPYEVAIEHELDLLRGLVQSSRKVELGWQQQREREIELDAQLRAGEQQRRVA